MQACPTISLVGETSVSGSLRAMDCQIEQAVEIGYNRLFGSGGAFASILTLSLTIYVALLAYGFLTGRTRLTMTMMSPRLMVMVLVLTFVSIWPAYHAVFYGLFMGGPDEVGAALLGQRGSSIMNFAETLDTLFVRFATIAKAFATDQANVATVLSSKSMPISLFWMSGLILLISTLGALILTRLILYLLLILGPLFILLALFSSTRGLFNGWIKTTLSFALMPLLIVLGGTAALMLFVPLIESIALDPMAAVNQVQPMVILFVGSLIYMGFLIMLLLVANGLVSSWQAALRDKSDQQSPPIVHVEVPAQGMASSSTRQDQGGSVRIEAMTSGMAQSERISERLMVDLGRSGAAGQSEGTSQASGLSRAKGLGQRFRAPTGVSTTQLSAQGKAI